VPDVRSFPHRVRRLVFEPGQAYEKFRDRYEAAVPPADPPVLGAFPGWRTRWPRPGLAGHEPGAHGLVMYERADLTPPVTAAGELRPCTAYLMGIEVLPEPCYHDDPAVLLYARLRTVICIGRNDRTQFAVDQPSTVLAGFAGPAVAQLGLDLDRRLAGLLDALGVGASQVLRSPSPVRG
jgi:hypothetical protein